VYRFWNMVAYWFPYRDVIGEDWDGVLSDALPKVAAAKDVASYKREMMSMIARVHDTHANLWNGLDERPPVGGCRLPVTLRFVGEEPVVFHALPGGALQVGDVVLSLDGAPVSRLVAEWLPFYAASNRTTQLRDIAASMTRGACGEVKLSVRRAGKELEVSMIRVGSPVSFEGSESMPRTAHDRPGETFQKIGEDVGYVKLSSITIADVPKYIEAAKGTKGLIVDIRNYPKEFVVFALGGQLVKDTIQFASFTYGDLANPGAFRFRMGDPIAPKGSRYEGKVVVLVDESSVSQAEYTAMALRGAGARIVGSTTAGADGNVSQIPLPGGLTSMFSGIGVFYPDRRPTQRVGIVPDVEVRPTVEGVRAGRDEVLEAALREIRGK
jgi:C-terminal processing protease CtpA/Prc